jgi:transcriptional regulator with XRE-family HTH domain
MRAAELGAFLRTRRSRLSPTDIGLPGGDRRRAPGLRREEVASVAGVAVSWLARLEQGRARSVSPDVLGALAAALRLDEVERAHLFALAGFRSESSGGDVTVGAALRALLDALEPNPAYILDRGWNIVAWNEAEARLFPRLAEVEAPNLLRLVFGDPDLARLMADHDEEMIRLVAQFRVHWTDWPDDPGLAMLVESLAASSPQFAALWAAEDVAPFVTTRRVFDHPEAGKLEFDHHRLAALDQPGVQVVVYTQRGPNA